MQAWLASFNYDSHQVIIQEWLQQPAAATDHEDQSTLSISDAWSSSEVDHADSEMMLEDQFIKAGWFHSAVHPG